MTHTPEDYAAIDDRGVLLHPRFKNLADGLYVLQHRRDDALPIGDVVEAIRSDGSSSLVVVKGRLALPKGTRAKYFEYIFKNAYTAYQSTEEAIRGSIMAGKSVRRLDGTWWFLHEEIEKPAVKTMTAG